MIKIQKEELEKTIDAFMREIVVMLKSFDKDEEVEIIEEIYNKKKKVMINDTEQYLKEVEHIDIS